MYTEHKTTERVEGASKSPSTAYLYRGTLTLSDRRSTLLAAVFVLACVLAPELPLLWTGSVPLRRDNLHIFFPLNHLTGSLLRDGELPSWTPYQMAGMPLMGDPEAGWGSLINMASYAALPLAEASAVTLAAQKALAALGTLLFLRQTGVRLPGAVLGALAYALSGPLLGPTIGSYLSYGNLSHTGTYAWFPWMLLGVDLAVRQRGMDRLASWCLIGFAGSQQISVWAGQGAYYAFLGSGAYLIFLTLTGETARGRSLVARTKDLLGQIAALAVVTLILSAWTLFPRLEFVAASNLSGGYGAGEQQFAGGASPRFPSTFFELGGAYVGAATITLAACALFLRPNRRRLFYGVMCVLVYAAALPWLVHVTESSRLIRSFLGLVPGFLELHLHFPQRVLFVGLFFGCALAATTLGDVLVAEGRARVCLPLAIVASGGVLLAVTGASELASVQYVLYGLGLAGFIAVVLLTWARKVSPSLAACLIAVFAGAELVRAVSVFHAGALASVGRPERFYGDRRAQDSLAMLRSSPPGRYFGYNPRALERAPDLGYRQFLGQPWTRALLVTTQATVLRLEDLQGYNPLHLRVYDRLLEVANGGRAKNYRNAYLTPDALESPLIDMLNVRYVLALSGTELTTKYALRAVSRGVLLHENTRALPRAWIVHDVERHADAAALRHIHSGRLDLRRVATVPDALPTLLPAVGAESVSVVAYTPDEIQVSVQLSAPGLLVLAELDYPAWKVDIDGEPAEAVRANGALRSVVVPTGTHTVTWRYRSTPTNLGFAVSTLGILALAAVFLRERWLHVRGKSSVANDGH